MSLTAADEGEAGERGTTLDYARARPSAAHELAGAGFSPIGKPLQSSRIVLVGLFCATMLLPTLGGRRVLTRHEVFAAEPAREMLHGGAAINWIIPHFAGIPRTVKPPTMGWLIAGSMALFHSEAEWVVRLPSGLSAILMTVLIADLAARWLGRRVGIIAGLMQATFVYVLMQARLAEADMPMAAAVCLAMYAFARGTVLPVGADTNTANTITSDSTASGMGAMGKRTRLPVEPVADVGHHGQASTLAHGTLSTDGIPSGHGTPSGDGTGSASSDSRDKTGVNTSRWLPILFYLGTGLSFLLKGVGIAFILTSVAAFIVWSAAEGRDWRRCVRFLLSPAGLLLLAVLLVAWPAAAWHADPNIFKTFRKELIGRASGEFGERQPWYFYAGVVPVMLMPWLPFGIGAMILGIRRRAFRGPVGQFLLCWFLPGLLILSTSAWKHHHYVIPMMPPATLVTAAGMELWLRGLKPQKAWFGAGLWFVGCSLAAVLVWRLAKTGRNEIIFTVALLAVGGTLASYAAGKMRVLATIGAVFGTAWAVSFAVGFAVIPEFEDYRWSAELAKRANSEVPAGKPIYLLDMGEHNTAFYLRFPLVRIDKPLQSTNWLATWSPLEQLYAICPTSLEPKLSALANVTELDRSQHLHKTESERDRPVLVRISLREESSPTF